MWLALALSAQADSITLDSGAVIEGDLARYEYGGDCQISVLEGPLAGVIVIVPCHRVESFTRTTPRQPVALTPPSTRGTSYGAAVPAAPAAVAAAAPVPAAIDGPAAEEAAARQDEVSDWFEPVLPPQSTAPLASGPAVTESAPAEAAPAPRTAEPLPPIEPPPAGGRPVSF